MSMKYRMPMNHVIETLILSATNDNYPLQVAEENKQLKERVEMYEKRIRKLESELERMRDLYGNEDTDVKEIRKLKERAHKILDKHRELKVFELVMKIFNVQPGEKLQYMTKRFIEEYFISSGNKKLISRDLELVIIKTSYGPMGWIVKKLQDS
ncbi:hypothetical protein [Thermococcus barophilus]|uniref:Uncharacterized protein n=1 Tax=Thermococcus barophilus TaxID=55802 RepID=A0A0S1XEB4_THEBA|nr:hypothetical protein [Thermococcus barophilus]ALM76048.1 hypothetical protein TBCH5v1_2147 [Thermococcus barophilus]